jgi:hypothetical protein
VLPALLLGALVVAEPAAANGVDLQNRAGEPGERIEVAGHGWLTCCPANTPVGHVALFLLQGGERLRLFDLRPNREGTIQGAFEVPSIRPGSYRLEVCSRGPDRPGVAPGATCLPAEETFTVLAGEATSDGPAPPTRLLAIGVATALVVLAAAALLFRWRR